MMDYEKLPVIVMGNDKGGCTEQGLTEDPDELTIIVRQGDRLAALVGDFELIGEMALEAGNEIKGGRIIVKEQFEPLDSDRPDFLIKKKKGKICRKNGKVIYSHSYFTYNKKDYDELIEPDND